MAEQQQPFATRLNGSTAPTMTMPDGTAVGADDDVGDAVISQGQSGPAVPVGPSGVPLDLTVPTVQQPYSLTTPPGVQRA